jgi:hypothetical protein
MTALSLTRCMSASREVRVPRGSSRCLGCKTPIASFKPRSMRIYSTGDFVFAGPLPTGVPLDNYSDGPQAAGENPGYGVPKGYASAARHEP